jgi:anti-sigma regulatory factor (Ser/Thr protein kinase)
MSALAHSSIEPVERECIHLSFPAAVDLVVIARFTAATIAARAGFGIDAIEDLRLAVDELCISLGPLSDDKALTLRFERADDMVEITASFAGVPGARDELQAQPPDAMWEQGRQLSERLLDSLVDEHGGEIRDGRRCTWLRKYRNTPQR